MSLTYQELIDTIESNPSGVREALELVKRQLAAYPSATSADDSDTLALSKDDGSGTTQALSIATLLLRAVTDNGGAVSFEVGTLANRPAAQTDGAWYFSTDEGVLYRDDGSEWGAILGNTSLVEQATDTGTDVYASGVNTTPPDAGYTVRRDFQSANTTTTPELDSLTITTRDGSALWANALSGVHELQLNAGGTAWLVLDPNPVSANSANAPVERDGNGRAKFADPSAAQDAATKAYADTKLAAPTGSTDPTLAFDTWRTPNATRPTIVEARIAVQTDGATNGRADFEVDESGGTTPDYLFITQSDSDSGAGSDVNQPIFAVIPAGGSYRIRNVSDPNAINELQVVREFTL